MGPLGITIFAAGLLFALGEMGFLTAAANSFIAFLCTLAFLAMNRPRQWHAVPPARLFGSVVLLILSVVFAQIGGLWLFLVFVAVPMALLLAIEEGSRRSEVGLLIPTVTLFMTFWIALRHVPHLWWLINTASVGFSNAIGRMIGQGYLFSATTSGFRVLAFVAAWGLSRFIWAKHRAPGDFAKFLVLLLAFSGLVQVLLTPLAIAIQRWAGDLDFLLFNPQVLYLIGAMVPITWYRRRTLGLRAGLPHVAGRKLLPAVLLAVVVLLTGALLGVGLTLVAGQKQGGGKVVLLDQGYLDWRVPVFGSYGDRSGGMFGRLPGWLEAQGYEVVKERGLLDSEALSGSRVLVIINLMKFLEPEEKRAIWDYVERGGSLLVLGDHTGVKGIRIPSNDLLKPFRIELEFDSATFWAQGWRDALELMPHPVNRGVMVAEDIQIWIGASLTFAPPARPVIVGKYGYSDIGDAAKIDRSYLGDRRYNPGERLGDVCLVAEAPYGEGRVLVFGDTSPFQNGALVTSWAFAQRAFQWLTGGPRPTQVLLRVIGLAVAAMSIVLLRGLLGRSPIAWAILVFGLVAGTQSADRLTAPPELPRIALPKALIDLSHGERFDQLTWYDDCIGGLELNLGRNGYSPMLMRGFSELQVRDSDVLVVIAPTRSFDVDELAAISQFVQGGGTLVVSTGYEEKDRSESLLSLFGIEVQPVPLAHFETDALGQTVRFAEAWPLMSLEPGAIPICHHPAYPDPVMAFVPKGKGGALVIGDSRFLLDANLEGREEWYLGNIMFLKAVFDSIKSGAFHR